MYVWVQLTAVTARQVEATSEINAATEMLVRGPASYKQNPRLWNSGD